MFGTLMQLGSEALYCGFKYVQNMWNFSLYFGYIQGKIFPKLFTLNKESKLEIPREHFMQKWAQ